MLLLMPSDVLVSAASSSVTSDATTLALRLQDCKNGRHRLRVVGAKVRLSAGRGQDLQN